MRKHHWFPWVKSLITAVAFFGVACLVALLVQPARAQGPQGGPRVITLVGPVSMDKDLRTLPDTAPPQPFHVQPLFSPNPLTGAPSASQPETVQPKLPAAPASMPSPILSFDSISETISTCNCLPPDANGDVGKSHYVQAVNSAFQVFDKSTGASLALPKSYNSLFSPLGTSIPCGNNNNQGDPIAFYDHLADRWVISDFAFASTAGPFYECIAVSKTGDPISGGYWLYAFQADSSNPSWIGDYPKLTMWPDAYYMSANMFDETTSAFQGVEVYALNCAAMLNGTGAPAPTVIAFTIPAANLGNTYTLLPAKYRFGAPPGGTPEYFASIDYTTGVLNTMHIWKFHVDFSTPSNSTFGVGSSHTPDANVTVANFTNALGGGGSSLIIPQSGTPKDLDSLGNRLMANLWYQNLAGAESLWATHTVNVTGATAIRWYQFNVTGGTIATTPLQQQTFSNNSDGLYRWMPSLSLDDNGNMSIGYSVSSSSIFPGIRYSGRLRSDPLNTLAQGEATLVSGGGNQTNNSGRWGDYSGMSVDPVNGCTFWYTNEYYSTSSNATWNTRIGNFGFPAQTGCSSPTAVELSSFNGFVVSSPAPSHVILRWKTGSEIKTVGFNLYRSERAEGPYTRINVQLVPGSGNLLAGGEYEYQDTPTAAGQTYYYQLEDIDQNGMSTRYKPIQVRVQFASEANVNSTAILGLGIVGGLVLLGGGWYIVHGKRNQS